MRAFLKLVEIQTKIASVTPFIWSIIFTGYYFGSLRLDLLLIFFASMLAFDMFTTALNNYLDKRAKKRHGYNYEEHNAIVRYGMSEKKVLLIIAVLFIAAAAFGLLLFSRTDAIVLLLGGLFHNGHPLFRRTCSHIKDPSR